MAEPHLTHDQEMEVESHAPYIKVWLALAVFTAIEYFWAHWFANVFSTLVLGLLFWAVIKASMVGWYFMHLKFEGRWVYYMLVPAGILAAVLTFALVPDVAMQSESNRETPEEEVWVPRGQVDGGWWLVDGECDSETKASRSGPFTLPTTNHQPPTIIKWTPGTVSEA
jgi:cytochrome c oxidase subunit 4